MAILVKKPGQLFPDSLLNAAAKFEHKAWGVAVVQDNSLVVLTESVKDAKNAVTAEEFGPQQETFKASHMILTMDGGVNQIMDDDLQPFKLLFHGENDQLLLVACLDGEFKQYETAGSSHTSHAEMFEKFLEPKVAKLFKKCGGNPGDLPKLLEELRGEDFKEAVEQACYPGGTVVIMASDGSEPVVISKNPNAKAFSFGFLTNTFGLQEKDFPATVAAPASPAKLTLAEKLAAAKARVQASHSASTGPSKEQIAAEPKPATQPAADPKTMADAVAQTGSADKEPHVWVKPKTNMSNSKAGQLYYKISQFTGVPMAKGAKESRPAVRVPEAYFKRELHNKTDIVDPPAQYQPFTPPAEAPADGGVGDLGKKLQEAQQLAPKDTGTHHIPVEVHPVLAAATKQWLRETVKLQPGLTSEVLQAMEKKHENYFEVGHSWEEISKWSFANFLAVAEDKKAGALLAWTLATKLRNTQQAIPKSLENVMKQRAAL